jgi:hypothetical protein
MTQEQALDILKMGHNVFLTGAPGTGKTYVINQYIAYLRDHDIPIAVTASTGIAATHIGGMTIHAWSGIGVRENLSEWDVEMMLEKKYIWDRFHTTKVLIIDEISMLSGSLLSSLDMLARAMKNKELPFGGMQVIFVGDFFQLPPIGGTGTTYAFLSDAWKNANMHFCYLQKSYRQDDGPLLSVLSHIRSCSVSDDTHDILSSCAVEEIVYDGERPLLFTHNVDVDTINQEKLNSLETPVRTFSMASKGSNKHIETLKKTLLTHEVLSLKEGSLVMFVKNNNEGKYVNGTLGTVVTIDNDDVIVETRSGDRIFVYPETWSMTTDDGKVLAEVTQLPLRLAWAITVHKSQGMTLDAVCMDLSQCFVPGQGYVALSRVKSLDGLQLLGYNDHALRVDPTVYQHDARFQSLSEKLVKRLLITDSEKKQNLHHDFIKKSGGSLLPVKKEKKYVSPKKKISTYHITKDFILEKQSLESIAEKRSVTVQTIMNHIEKLLKDEDITISDIQYLQPKEASFKKDIAIIEKALKKVEDEKLSTLKTYLENAYSYEELKFLLLFCKKK